MQSRLDVLGCRPDSGIFTHDDQMEVGLLKPFSKVLKGWLISDVTALTQTIEKLSPEEAEEVLSEFDADELSGVIERLETTAAIDVLQRVRPEKQASIFDQLPPRVAALLMRRLPDAVQTEMLSHGSTELKERLQNALSYPHDTAGGIMEPLASTLLSDYTVDQAITVVRGAPRDTLFYLYVVDRERKLVGVLNTRELLLANPSVLIADLAHRNVVSVPATLDREEVANLMRERNFLALPVIGEDGRLLGVVSHEQVVETVEEEAFEDLQRMVGAGADEKPLSPVGTVVFRRFPWLCLNLVTTFVAAAIVGVFQPVIAQVTALAVLLPIVAGQAGNSGAQSLAVVLRGLALDEVAPGSVYRLLRKELLAGAVNGLLIAIVTALGVWLWCGTMGLPIVIGVSMWMCLVLSPLVGAGIPLLLHRAGLDPAQSSTIFLTTFTEIAGFGLFLGLASLCMRWLL